MLDGDLKETQFDWPKEDPSPSPTPLSLKSEALLSTNQVTYITGLFIKIKMRLSQLRDNLIFYHAITN